MKIEIRKCSTDLNWIRFLIENQCKVGKPSIESKILEIDVSATFLEPFHIATLACFLESFFINGYEIVIQCNNQNTYTFLKDINFLKMWQEPLRKQNTFFSNRFSSLGLWNIHPKMLDQYTNSAKNYFDLKVNSNITKSNKSASTIDLSPLHITLSETINNVCDHSNAESKCFTISQYYPKKKFIKTTICDFGIGIVQSVRDFIQLDIDSIDAFNLALKEGFTVKSRQYNAGLGLTNLMNCVLNCRGEVKLFSNDIVYKVNIQKESLTKSPINFQGTVINLTFDINYFDQKDEDFIDFDYF